MDTSEEDLKIPSNLLFVNEMFKGIVSRDFKICFLVPLDSSDIATPAGTGSFF
jgi:hypothetical protein